MVCINYKPSRTWRVHPKTSLPTLVILWMVAKSCTTVGMVETCWNPISNGMFAIHWWLGFRWPIHSISMYLPHLGAWLAEKDVLWGAEIFPLRHRARCVGVSTMCHGNRKWRDWKQQMKSGMKSDETKKKDYLTWFNHQTWHLISIAVTRNKWDLNWNWMNMI